MKQFTGVIRSDKMQKTAVVEVAYFWQHPLYQKRVKKTKRYMADNQLDAKIGDTVIITESRPLSKHKRWVISQIINK